MEIDLLRGLIFTLLANGLTGAAVWAIAKLRNWLWHWLGAKQEPVREWVATIETAAPQKVLGKARGGRTASSKQRPQ